jgi:AcrR family transcriptional regulator
MNGTRSVSPQGFISDFFDIERYPHSIDHVSVDEPRPPRLTRAETKARTRTLLLAAAAKVLARKGFAGASVEDIAETAGFTIGALYANFGGKEAVFVELLANQNTLRLNKAANIVSDQDVDLDETRANLNRFLVDTADTDIDLAALQAEFWLYAVRRPELLEHLASQFRDNRDALATVLAERAENRSQPRNVPFDDVATVVLALFQGMVQLRRTAPDLVSADLYGTALTWMFTGLNKVAREQA